MSTIPAACWLTLGIGRANHNVGDVCLRAFRAEQQPSTHVLFRDIARTSLGGLRKEFHPSSVGDKGDVRHWTLHLCRLLNPIKSSITNQVQFRYLVSASINSEVLLFVSS
jgi:hypothetical protein